MTAVTDIATRPVGAVQTADAEWSVEHILNQTLKIQQLMEKVLKRDEHYGVIPGTKGVDGKPPKPTLLKPGAEKLCLMFRLDPEYDTVTSTETQQLFAYTIRCTLFHIPTGSRIASGLGSCNSRETKYVRPAPKLCPTCGKETIIKGKEEYGGGWLCFAKKGGCGAKWKDGDETIEKQPSGIADPSDLANTILKMACKRALIAAVLNGTAASDCFTQDLEDLTEKAAEYIPPPAKAGADPKGDGGSSSQTTSRQTSSPTGEVETRPKAPRANTIKHDGTFAGAPAVKLLHVLKGKVGGLTEDAYRKQLAAFKDADGKPITTSTDLSEAQIDNLIDRYKKKIAEQEKRAAEDPDTGAIFPTTLEIADLRGKLVDQDFVEAQWCSDLFGVDNLAGLTKAQSQLALELVLARAKGPDDYDFAVEKAREDHRLP
jgi:hypothetical protein